MYIYNFPLFRNIFYGLSNSCVLDPDILVHKSQFIHFQELYEPVNETHYLTNS